MSNDKNITILGAGSWGMALARHIARGGYPVTVWARNRDKLDCFDRERIYHPLSDMPIPKEIVFEADLACALSNSAIVIFAVPSVNIREVAGRAAPHISDGSVLASVAKGIEPGTLMTMSEIIGDEMGRAGRSLPIAALSGPTHAEEVARDLPTTIVSASLDPAAAALLQDTLMDSTFRVYTGSDIRGVEYCGALKNIMALASGISSGLGFGDNAGAALITRALHEMARLFDAMGLKRETLFGLAGVGDLIVTCASMNSRNLRAGILIGRGKSVEEAKKEIGMVVEGINCIPAALSLASAYDVQMPILMAVDDVINHGRDPGQAVRALMLRDKKDETE